VQKPAWVRVVWSDLNKILPDMNFVQVRMDDLAQYMVDGENGKQPLAAYLTQKPYSGYVIRLNSGDLMMGVRTFNDAMAITELVETGKLKEALEFYNAVSLAE
ncbi:MAG: hypothetical protein AAF570_29415, partial [Bacteroidota bacterium]